MSTVLPRWPHFTHYVEDGNYFGCTIWSCKFTSSYAIHFTNRSLVLETIKDKDLFSHSNLFLYSHWKEYAISLRLIWWQNNNERISHSNWYFCQRLYLFLLMLQYVAPMHIFITLLYIKAVKNLLLEFISANFLKNPLLTIASNRSSFCYWLLSRVLYVTDSCRELLTLLALSGALCVISSHYLTPPGDHPSHLQLTVRHLSETVLLALAKSSQHTLLYQELFALPIAF